MRLSWNLAVMLAWGAGVALGADIQPLPDSSLYLLESKWQRDDGKSIMLADLRGEVRVMSMFFTSCDNLCPMILGELKSLERAMPAALKDQVGFVLVTMDTKTDSPAALRRYRKESQLPAETWMLLRGNADDTRELAALLGVRYTPKQMDGQMGHNGLITILNHDGEVVFRTQSITDQQDFLARLTSVVASKPSGGPKPAGKSGP